MRWTIFVYGILVMVLKGLALALLMCAICQPRRARRLVNAGRQRVREAAAALRRLVTKLRHYPSR